MPEQPPRMSKQKVETYHCGWFPAAFYFNSTMIARCFPRTRVSA
jgi:hypothetical protein